MNREILSLLGAFPLPLTTQPSFNQFGRTGVQWFGNQVAVVTESKEGLPTKYDLQKASRFLLQSGAPSTLRLTKLNSTFFALLGGELRHETFAMIAAGKAKSSAFH